MTAPTTDSAMYRTMHRQPDEVRRLLAAGWEPARQAADRLVGATRVFLVGIGTSYHAALVGSWLLRAAGSDARALLSFDVAVYPEAVILRPDDAVIVLAHTGVKRFSAEARAAGASVISIGSLSAEHPSSQLVLRTVERETSAAFTASRLAAMTVLAQVAIALRRCGPGLDPRAAARPPARRGLRDHVHRGRAARRTPPPATGRWG
jgi:glutamine---fructose-6-phosphate transaminase (isomerizing)